MRTIGRKSARWAGVAVAAALLTVVVPGVASASETKAATSAIPCSPDGICDARLYGNKAFSVNDGTYDHRFTFLGGQGEDGHWREDVYLWSVEINSYTFACGGSGCPVSEE